MSTRWNKCNISIFKWYEIYYKENVYLHLDLYTMKNFYVIIMAHSTEWRLFANPKPHTQSEMINYKIKLYFICNLCMCAIFMLFRQWWMKDQRTKFYFSYIYENKYHRIVPMIFLKINLNLFDSMCFLWLHPKVSFQWPKNEMDDNKYIDNTNQSI